MNIFIDDDIKRIIRELFGDIIDDAGGVSVNDYEIVEDENNVYITIEFKGLETITDVFVKNNSLIIIGFDNTHNERSAYGITNNIINNTKVKEYTFRNGILSVVLSKNAV